MMLFDNLWDSECPIYVSLIYDWEHHFKLVGLGGPLKLKGCKGSPRNFIKGTLPQNIFSLKSSHIKHINYSDIGDLKDFFVVAEMAISVFFVCLKLCLRSMCGAKSAWLPSMWKAKSALLPEMQKPSQCDDQIIGN